MANTTHISPSDEECTLAALAHASIIANPVNLLGVIGTAIIWATQHRRSAYVAHHALHALVFQGVGFLLMVVMGLAWGSCMIVSMLPAMMRPALYHNDKPLSFWLVLIAGLVLLLFVLFWIGYGLFGAWAAWNGRWFSYGFLGRLLRRRLSPDTTNSLHDTPDEAMTQVPDAKGMEDHS